MVKVQNIALLTSGGDSPGMNACVRAIVRASIYHGLNAYGVIDGFNGLIKDEMKLLSYDDVSYILQKGGTVLGTARCKEFHQKEFRQQAFENLKSRGVDALIVIGGDGSFTGARLLAEETGVAVIGIPATIDNDIFGTDYCIGFDTAMNNIIDAVDKIRDTASSHHRVFLVEVMGNNSGMLALHTAAACGAEEVFMPEKQEDLEEFSVKIQRALDANKSSIIIVAEGDEFGGAAEIFNYLKEKGMTERVRISVLGHLQRGGTPTYIDRLYSTLYGEHAVVSLLKGKSGLMIGHKNGELVEVDMAETGREVEPKNMDYLKLIRKLSVY